MNNLIFSISLGILFRHSRRHFKAGIPRQNGLLRRREQDPLRNNTWQNEEKVREH